VAPARDGSAISDEGTGPSEKGPSTGGDGSPDEEGAKGGPEPGKTAEKAVPLTGNKKVEKRVAKKVVDRTPDGSAGAEGKRATGALTEKEGPADTKGSAGEGTQKGGRGPEKDGRADKEEAPKMGLDEILARLNRPR
jgi:hypothetical protein